MEKQMKVKIQIGYLKNGKGKTKKKTYKLFPSHWSNEDRETMLRDELKKSLFEYTNVYFVSMYWKDEDKTHFIDRRYLYA